MSETIISGQYEMSTSPKVSYNLSYEAKRSEDGGALLYRFRIDVLPVTGSSYFAYNLKTDISVNGEKLVTGGKIKDTSPSQWSKSITTYFPHYTGWYRVSLSEKTELPCTVKVYSTQTKGSASSEGRTVIVPEYESSVSGVKIKVGSQWKTAQKVYIKANGQWQEAKKVYIKVNGIWKEV